MPARVQQAVREENLRFLKSRDVYCPDYYEFIFELCQVKKKIGTIKIFFFAIRPFLLFVELGQRFRKDGLEYLCGTVRESCRSLLMSHLLTNTGQRIQSPLRLGRSYQYLHIGFQGVRHVDDRFLGWRRRS